MDPESDRILKGLDAVVDKWDRLINTTLPTEKELDKLARQPFNMHLNNKAEALFREPTSHGSLANKFRSCLVYVKEAVSALGRHPIADALKRMYKETWGRVVKINTGRSSEPFLKAYPGIHRAIEDLMDEVDKAYIRIGTSSADWGNENE